MTYPVTSTSTTLIDHVCLAQLQAMLMDSKGKVLLVGFNEYAKHLANLHPEKIAGIVDPDARKQGIRWRGLTVGATSTKMTGIADILVTDFKYLYELQGQLDRLYDHATPIRYPSQIHYRNTDFVDPKSQQAIYRAVLKDVDECPPSMMDENKIFFLLENVRAALRVPGDIVEMGVYQGGSSWYIARLLNALKETRSLFLFDLFEQHSIHPNATMCNDEIERAMSFYPYVRIAEGLISDRDNLARISGRPLCFAHYDLGWDEAAMAALWEGIVPGGHILLDNYGHLSALTWRFDEFFSERGHEVMRFPWSEQGLIIRHV